MAHRLKAAAIAALLALAAILPAGTAIAPIASAHTGNCTGSNFTEVGQQWSSPNYGAEKVYGQIVYNGGACTAPIPGEHHPSAWIGFLCRSDCTAATPFAIVQMGIETNDYPLTQATTYNVFWEVDGCGHINGINTTSYTVNTLQFYDFEIDHYSGAFRGYFTNAAGTHLIFTAPDSDPALSCWATHLKKADWLFERTDDSASFGSSTHAGQIWSMQYSTTQQPGVGWVNAITSDGNCNYNQTIGRPNEAACITPVSGARIDVFD